MVKMSSGLVLVVMTTVAITSLILDFITIMKLRKLNEWAKEAIDEAVVEFQKDVEEKIKGISGQIGSIAPQIWMAIDAAIKAREDNKT